jgi:ABC-type transport system involved in cytochrome c biogenesis ATPase subunit
MLAPTTVEVAAGELVIVHGDPGHGHTALALALAGRLVPDRRHCHPRRQRGRRRRSRPSSRSSTFPG